MKNLSAAGASAALLFSAVTTYAGQPVTVNNAANTDSAAVSGHALNVTITGSGGGGVTALCQTLTAAPSYGNNTFNPLYCEPDGDLHTTITDVPSGAYTAGSIVDLGTGSSPAANTTNNYLQALSANGTPSPTSALATSKVVLAAPGSLKYFQVAVDSTVSAAAWQIQVLDASSDPGNSTIAPKFCYQFPAGQSVGYSQTFNTPVAFATGITIVVSSGTACLTEATVGNHTFISGVY